MKILIVDDSSDAAESFQMLLELDGHDVKVAPTGEVALALFDDFLPDAALIDISLPGMDGYTLARELRSRAYQPSPRLIAVTGYGGADDLRRSAEAGFDKHLTKPISYDSLATHLVA